MPLKTPIPKCRYHLFLDNLLNLQNYPFCALIFDKIANFALGIEDYWKKWQRTH